MTKYDILSNSNILYLVTNRSHCSMSQFKIIISEALRAGVNIVQLREKNLTDKEYLKIALEVKEITDRYNSPLIINDNPLVAKEVKASGVHIGQTDTTVTEARKILGKKAIVGISIENIAQARQLQQEHVDYAAISPVFTTNTKKDVPPLIGLDNAKTIRNIISIPLFIIGGINTHNIRDVMLCGVNGVCVISSIFKSNNPFAATVKLKALMNLGGK